MGSIKKRGDIYYIDFYVHAKRFRKAVGKNKKDAQEALKAIEGEIVKGEFNIPVQKRIRFKEFAILWLETYSKVKNKPSSFMANFLRTKNHLIPFFGNQRIESISSLLIDEFIRYKQSQISSATINRCLSLLSKIFNDAIRWGYLSTSPMKKVSKLNEPVQGFNYLTKDQVKKLLENASDNSRAILMTAVYTGMRRGEIIALKWKHIDFEKKMIIVEETTEGSTKSKKVRYIPIHPELLLELKKHKLKTRSEYVFPGPDGEMRKEFRSALNYALKRAELPRIRVHDLRHTFAANFMMSGGNILSLQKILGHSDLKMTMRYAHLAPDFLQQEIEKLDYAKKITPGTGMKNPNSGLQNGPENSGVIEPNSENFGHKMGTSQKSGKSCKPENPCKSLKSLVPEEGIEPSRCYAPRDFESRASPSSTTPAWFPNNLAQLPDCLTSKLCSVFQTHAPSSN